MPRDLTIVLRGYHMVEVDRLLDQAEAALASSDPVSRGAARDALDAAGLTVELRGYDRGQVDRLVERYRAGLTDGAAPPAAGPPSPPDFLVVLRGYDRGEVDRAIETADRALASGSESAQAAARDALRGNRFSLTWRGYDRGQVDRAVEQLLARMA